jgi:hypothetical protein
LYNEKLDLLLDSHFEGLRALYNNYCKKMRSSLENLKLMLMPEWENMLQKCKVIDDDFSKREAR